MAEPTRPMTLTQKILADHAVGLTRPWVQAGDMLRIRVDWTIASELAWNGMDRTYAALGRPRIHNKDRFFLAVDHTVDPVTLATDARAKKLQKLSQDFALESGIKHFYDANQTILHTKFYRDLVQPGEVVLGADSHTSSHGGLGAFAIGLGGADITAAMVLGESWTEVPEAIAVDYQGAPPFGLGGKDVILKTLGTLGRNTVAMERSVEYRGDAVRGFSTDTRFTIANMTAEFGGLNGIFEADGVVAAWLRARDGYNDGARYFRADDGAPYVSRHQIDLATLEPLVAKPFSPDNVATAASCAGQALDGLFIGACTTTEEELVLAALLLEVALAAGESIKPTRNRLVVPGDLSIEKNLADHGLLAIYEKAGFRVGPPGCSMCLGVASEKAGKGEVWLSSQNRNYQNRMGEGSLAWLSSAATVAASAPAMRLTDPRPLLARVDRDRFERILGKERRTPLPEVRVTQPHVQVSEAAAHEASAGHDSEKTVRGRVQRMGDHVDTDAIIPGQFCHLTKLEELGDHCFELVHPEFRERARGGANIIVAGEGWGSGSSREQAVWALQGASIQVVVAKSFAFIHKRNLVNEALPYLQVTDPAFYELIKDGDELEITPGGAIRHPASGRSFAAQSVTPMIHALQREGGLVAAIKQHGPGVFSELAGG
jgi:aconitate hydratase/homoaconitate hydratase